jgi:parallel beta-helix repeat protein
MSRRRAGLVSGVWAFTILVAVFDVALNVPLVQGSGTIYIRADGSIEPSTAPIFTTDNVTYTFTDNINDSIVIERENIVVDGEGYTAEGTGGEVGIRLIGRSNVTIKNMTIKSFYGGVLLYESSNNSIYGNKIITNDIYGIRLQLSHNNTIYGNDIRDNLYCIELYYSSNNILSENNVTTNNGGGMFLLDSSSNIISENIVLNNSYGMWFSGSSNCAVSRNVIMANYGDGIKLSGSSNNTVFENNITGNGKCGILLSESSNNVFRINRIAGNLYNLWVDAKSISDFVHDIDVSNIVDGKPVYYWISMRDATVPLGAGYIALVECIRINVGNQNLTKNGQGILLANTSNSTITKNNMMNNGYGVILYWSCYHNTISENNITNNSYGMWFSGSSNNTISENHITNNIYGISLERSSNYNSIARNTFINDGLFVSTSYGNTLEDNVVNGKPLVYLEDVSDYTVCHAGQVILINCDKVRVENCDLSGTTVGLELWGTTNSTIANNRVANNIYGIWLYRTSSCSIGENNITNNQEGVQLDSCSNNSISKNTITQNDGNGIYLGSSSENAISQNNISTNGNCGIMIYLGWSNTIYANNITANSHCGIMIYWGQYNTIYRNNIANNLFGIYLYSTDSNEFFHNNFIDNIAHVGIESYYPNFWDDGIEGNYWSNYDGKDADHDGIGDIQYWIDSNNIDNNPLMGLFRSFDTSLGPHVNIISNSTIDEFEYSESNNTIKMYVSNAVVNQTFGFCRICVPHVLMNPNNTWVIIDDGHTQALFANFTLLDNSTCRWIFFAYPHSTRKIMLGEDNIMPTTAHVYDGLWCTTDFTILLAATDDLSGVAETYYRINDGPIQNVSAHGQPLITIEGADNKLEYWSIDNAGNEELPHKILTGIKLDKAYPTIETPSRTPDGDVLPDQSVKVSVNVTDATSNVKNVTLSYTINDGETWTDLPMNHTVSNLYEATIPPQQADTTVRFKIIAYDYAGNNATLDGTQPYCIYQVIPEFPSSLILPIFMIITLLAATAYKRKHLPL